MLRQKRARSTHPDMSQRYSYKSQIICRSGADVEQLLGFEPAQTSENSRLVMQPHSSGFPWTLWA
jgi:hypothetical protein